MAVSTDPKGRAAVLAGGMALRLPPARDRSPAGPRRAGAPESEGVRWESAGEGDFTIETVDKASRGTDVILHLREGEDELLDGNRLRTILRKYSDHITVPVLMKKEEWDSEAKATKVTGSNEVTMRLA